jgi:hypothetical protein
MLTIIKNIPHYAWEILQNIINLIKSLAEVFIYLLFFLFGVYIMIGIFWVGAMLFQRIFF